MDNPSSPKSPRVMDKLRDANEIFFHASYCVELNCRTPSCSKLKEQIFHWKTCKNRANGKDPTCEKMLKFVEAHKGFCADENCKFSFCPKSQVGNVASETQWVRLSSDPPVSPGGDTTRPNQHSPVNGSLAQVPSNSSPTSPATTHPSSPVQEDLTAAEPIVNQQSKKKQKTAETSKKTQKKAATTKVAKNGGEAEVAAQRKVGRPKRMEEPVSGEKSKAKEKGKDKDEQIGTSTSVLPQQAIPDAVRTTRSGQKPEVKEKSTKRKRGSIEGDWGLVLKVTPTVTRKPETSENLPSTSAAANVASTSAQQPVVPQLTNIVRIDASDPFWQPYVVIDEKSTIPFYN